MVVAKSDGVICGLQFALETYYAVEPRVRWMPAVSEGLRVAAGATIAHVDGPVHAILRGERVALNYLGRLSGIATQTADCVRAVAGSGARILDTRKTTPGLRVAERYAVRVGGGLNHRNDLRAGLLVKDNHIAAVRARGGSLADAVRLALVGGGPGHGRRGGGHLAGRAARGDRRGRARRPARQLRAGGARGGGAAGAGRRRHHRGQRRHHARDPGRLRRRRRRFHLDGIAHPQRSRRWTSRCRSCRRR